MKEGNKTGALPSLMDLEHEVEAEGREWTRKRMEQRLQEFADQHGEVFPPQRKAAGAPKAKKTAAPKRRRKT